MGHDLMTRPPKFVHRFIDRHGKPRFYFRRAGFKQVPLPGLPWSPEFMAAYELAMAGQPLQIGSSRVNPGSLHAFAVSYFNSIGFRSMNPKTQRVYRNIIDRFCAEHGDKRGAMLQREHIVKLMATRADKPESANMFRKALRAMMRHAVETGLRGDDPTATCGRSRRSLMVSTLGRMTRSPDLRSHIRSVRAPGLPSRCCCTRGSAALMWCAWAASTFAMACCRCANRRPEPSFQSRFTRRLRQRSPRRRAITSHS